MNRKFTHEDSARSIEDEIITILKGLISESDYLLNFHDGSGYYYPKYIDKWRNPIRFGQSIIADFEEYNIPASNKIIRLGAMARDVLDEVNLHIKNELHKFHFMNTRTDDSDSLHREQRKSATYYALTTHHTVRSQSRHAEEEWMNDKLSLCLDDRICLEEIQTNLYSRSGIHLHINGHQVRRGESMPINELGATRHNRFDVRKGLLVLGGVFIDTIGHN